MPHSGKSGKTIGKLKNPKYRALKLKKTKQNPTKKEQNITKEHRKGRRKAFWKILRGEKLIINNG